MPLVAVGGEVAHARIRDHDDVAAASAVAAVGPAARNVRLAAEADAAVAAAARLHVDCRPVIEHDPEPSAAYRPSRCDVVALHSWPSWRAGAPGRRPPRPDARVHNYRGVVPVLVYHGIAPQPAAGDAYSIGQAEFARHMAMLDRNGFHAISIEQYAGFVAGDVDGLPNRPILITFDDGRLDSYQGADAVLERHHMRATMFAITANAVTAKPGYLTGRSCARWRPVGVGTSNSMRTPDTCASRPGPAADRAVLREPALPQRHPREVQRVQAPCDVRHPARTAADGERDPEFRAGGLRGPVQRLRPAAHELRADPRMGDRLAARSVPSRLRSGQAHLQRARQRHRTALRHPLGTTSDHPRGLAARGTAAERLGLHAETPEAAQTARRPAHRRARLPGARRHHVARQATPRRPPVIRTREGEPPRAGSGTGDCGPERGTSIAQWRSTPRGPAAPRSRSGSAPGASPAKRPRCDGRDGRW